RRVFESRQLVHTVIDSDERFQMPREAERHRCVVPEKVIGNLVLNKQFILQQRLLQGNNLKLIQTIRQVLDDYLHTEITRGDFQARDARAIDRLFDKKD